ncbi:prolyl-tRNA synthetase associated domain-containing protein [Ferrimonas sp. SCSIO 43195]|uniref:prolyl-tRNA synthetase associated domain-containing protein n=1 Tax=Ferrimonas sp. SCSIO 43195 TaxID=2822844 RepID=UPI002074DE6D|nr:prolyl-tRNA synthetase associated domain-containing protein [Ferrimonas sp. SCSIO 43195]USD38161.1 prolyl-tRNA synthetase associated domain-containing protein [Ferrimonas sp. SCSIO 43195]
MNIESLLESHDIEFEKFEHPPLETCCDADRLQLHRPGQRLKNLFLRDNYGRRHFLLITSADKAVDLKALSRQLSLSRLGFASAERLSRYLKVRPGCVSLLALVNDPELQVELWLDESVWQGEAFQCHPLINTATLVLEKAQVERFLQLTNHIPVIMPIPQQAAMPS